MCVGVRYGRLIGNWFLEHQGGDSLCHPYLSKHVILEHLTTQGSFLVTCTMVFFFSKRFEEVKRILD